MKESELLWKKNVAEQCQKEYEIRKFKRDANKVQGVIDHHSAQLNFLKSPENQVAKMSPDVIVHHWLHNTAPLSAKQQLLCYDIYESQKRYSLLMALGYGEASRVLYRNRSLENLSEQDRQACADVSGPLPVVFSGLDILQNQMNQSQCDLQEDVYRDHLKLRNDQKYAIILQIHKDNAVKKELHASLQHGQAGQAQLSKNFSALKNNHDSLWQMLDKNSLLQFKKLQNFAWKKVVQEQKKEAEEQDCMAAEELMTQNVVRHEKKQAHIMHKQKQREFKHQQKELQAMEQEEKDRRSLLEQERRMKQSQADKQRNLLQLQEQQQDRLKKEQELVQKADQQRILAEQNKTKEEIKECLIIVKQQKDLKILEEAIENSTIEKAIISRMPKIPERMSYKKFLKELHEQPLFNTKMEILLAGFSDITKTIVSSDNVDESSISYFDELYGVMIDAHKKLVDQGKGLSYHMALQPKLYSEILRSYVWLHKKIGDHTPASLQSIERNVLENINIHQQEFDLLKASYKDAVTKRDDLEMGKFLPLMKHKQAELSQLKKYLRESQSFSKQFYIYTCLLKTCGNGGILDPYRLVDVTANRFSCKEVAMQPQELDIQLVILNDHIEKILKKPDVVDEKMLDPILKISAPKMGLVYQKTLRMIDNVFSYIGLQDHPHKNAWAKDFYRNARSFSLDDAQSLIDLDTYRYSLQKTFDPAIEQCTLAQYNTKQDMLMKLIRLYSKIFHKQP